MVFALLAAPMLTGCVSNPGTIDPYEKTNRAFFHFNEAIDRYALKPVTDFYVKVVPAPIRTGVDNGFHNLEYANVILNDFLQAKWGQGFSDTGRMAVNSTVGIAGFFDPATGWGMPIHDNDFGITLAKWGVKPGPYLVLPILGPMTLRDTPNIGVALVCDPVFWVGVPAYVSFPLRSLQAVNYRARADNALRFAYYAAIDPYVFMREGYLAYRENQINEGKVRPNQSIYDEDTDMGPSTAPSTAPTSATSTAPSAAPAESQPASQPGS
jgi:phospholipid-binding lipoprotein MlaA